MRSLLIETLASMLNAFLLPVYTLKVDLDSLASHFTLPAAKIILRYLLLNTESLAEPSFQRRMQIWPSLCKLLNELKDTTPSGLAISLISYCLQAFFGHFEKNSRLIPKKLKQFSPKNSSEFVKNSIICQLKTNFFLHLFSFGKIFQKYCPKT